MDYSQFCVEITKHRTIDAVKKLYAKHPEASAQWLAQARKERAELEPDSQKERLWHQLNMDLYLEAANETK
jgi:hypothetical protein